MNYRISHKTLYTYSEQASISQNELYLQPRGTLSQQVKGCKLDIKPTPQYLRQRVDYFGNISQVFMVQQPHQELSITAISEVVTSNWQYPQPNQTPSWESVRQSLKDHQSPESLDACQFAYNSPMTARTPEFISYSLGSFQPGTPILVASLNLIHRIHTEFAYDKASTTVDTPVEQLLVVKKGVCQDFAHFAISCIRSIGLAARYVSGYLETLPPPGSPKLIGADASHAWISIFIPGCGWVDLDPTNNTIPGERHVTVAWGRDYTDVTPVKGIVMGGGVHTLNVTVDVAALPSG